LPGSGKRSKKKKKGPLLSKGGRGQRKPSTPPGGIFSHKGGDREFVKKKKSTSDWKPAAKKVPRRGLGIKTFSQRGGGHSFGKRELPRRHRVLKRRFGNVSHGGLEAKRKAF